jgi:hypothetical protein
MYGETRIIKKFAWLPILTTSHGYWLTTVKIKQKYTNIDGWIDQTIIPKVKQEVE